VLKKKHSHGKIAIFRAKIKNIAILALFFAKLLPPKNGDSATSVFSDIEIL
jgi:hypothetical protein